MKFFNPFLIIETAKQIPNNVVVPFSYFSFCDFKQSVYSSEILKYNDTLAFVKDVFLENVSLYFTKNFYINLFDCITRDFSMELLDTCYNATIETTFEAQTAINRFGYNRSASRLFSSTTSVYNKANPNDEWNYFLAAKMSLNSKSVDICAYGGSALVTILSLLENKVRFPYNLGFCSTDFIKLYDDFHDILPSYSDSWNNLKNIFPYPQEFTLYHLEKLWRINYTAKIFTYFKNIDIGHFIIPPTATTNTLPKYIKYSPISQDMEPYWMLLQAIASSNDNLQTNLYILEHCLTTRFILNETSLQILIPLINEVIPFIKNWLWYLILRNCSQQSLIGQELYYSLLDYSFKFAKNTIHDYSLTTLTTCPSKLNDIETYHLEKIINILYPNEFLAMKKFSPSEYKKYIMEYKKAFKTFNFSQQLFEDGKEYYNF